MAHFVERCPMIESFEIYLHHYDAKPKERVIYTETVKAGS